MVKNPLIHRHLRDLKHDLGKYLVLFLLLVLSIGEISGFLVADESMIAAYDESFEKYRIEDGHFSVQSPLTPAQISRIRESDVELYELFYADRQFENGSTLRLFKQREEVDLVCLMQGDFPAGTEEIAIDRMYADNNGLKVGDTLEQNDGKVYRISGLVALSDYSTMFQDNNDMMFDAKNFGVAVLAPEAFDSIDPDRLIRCYAWMYREEPADEAEEKDKASDFLKQLSRTVKPETFVPRYQNQAITFTGEDMGSDRAMTTLFLYIIMVITAFVFAVTTSNTILKESTVIGTLMATGYTRAELRRHYMFMPVVVTLAAALLGNVLGYTWLKQVNADLYYASYSLPTYVTRWSAQAFLETTVIPVLLMFLINYLSLTRRLQSSPLAFLRRQLSSGGFRKRKNVLPLPKRLPFFSRFRLRIFFQNFSGYLTMGLGIFFANTLLLFGLMMPSVLKNYMISMQDGMFANYQYILKVPEGIMDEDRPLESMVNLLLFEKSVETDTPDAEKFSVYSLRTLPTPGVKQEELLIYGVDQDSQYIRLSYTDTDQADGALPLAAISSAYADKWELSVGSVVELSEVYEEKTYQLQVAEIFPYDGAVCLFMEKEEMNRLFELGDDFFAGYFSDSPITDIDESLIGQVIDYRAITRISTQLDISLGGMMKVLSVFAVLIYMLLVYLLSKIIIEKNASAISMIKILGYTDREIGRLYILATALVVLLFLLLSLPLTTALMTWAFRVLVRSEMVGWVPFVLDRVVFVKMMLYGVGTFGIVALLELRKIGKVPMEEALKNVE